MPVRYYLIALGFLSLFPSCRKENALDCFKANGKDRSDLRILGDFHTVEISSKIDVTILQGSDYSVEVIAGKNIIKNLSAKVSNGVLLIDNLNTCNFVRGYKRGIKVNITASHIQKVINNGVGTITFSEGFTEDTLVVRAESSGDIHVNGAYNQIRTSSHGNGDMYVSGSCNSFFIYAKGTNFVHAEDLKVKDYIFVHSLTLGDCHINAESLNKLEANIQDDGNVYYKGEPLSITDFSDGKTKGRMIKE